MSVFAKYLRRNKGGGANEIKDKASKAKFAREIDEMVDPEKRAELGQQMHEEMILRSHREPTVKEVLTELARQAKRLREKRPNCPLDCYVGAYAMALLAQVRSYPEHTLGLEIRLDRFIPPWDTVVMYRDAKGKRHGGIL